jgi:hypothetical protein
VPALGRLSFAAASPRLCTLSFSRTLCTWFFTVVGSMDSRDAMALFDNPSATRSAICASRSVSAVANPVSASRLSRARLKNASARSGEHGLSPRAARLRTRTSWRGVRRDESRHAGAGPGREIDVLLRRDQRNQIGAVGGQSGASSDYEIRAPSRVDEDDVGSCTAVRAGRRVGGACSAGELEVILRRNESRYALPVDAGVRHNENP